MKNNSDLPLVFIHTLPPLIGVFDHLTKEIIGNIKTAHILDEPLLIKIKQKGKIEEEDRQRLLSHIHYAEQINAVAVLVTCSTLSPVVEEIRNKSKVPIVLIDEFMIDQAVNKSTRIGVIATATITLEPTRKMLEKRAAQLNKKIEIKMHFVDQALDLLLQGKGQEHDRLVISAVHEFSQSVDLIVLAQASMARILDVLPEDERSVPILASPYLALEQVKSILDKKKSNISFDKGEF